MAKLLPSSSTSTPSRFASSADPPPPWTPPDRLTLGLHCVDGHWSSRRLTAGTKAAARSAASPEPCPSRGAGRRRLVGLVVVAWPSGWPVDPGIAGVIRLGRCLVLAGRRLLLDHDQRAISVPLTPVKGGMPRSLTGSRPPRSALLSRTITAICKQGVRGSSPLSSTPRSSRFTRVHVHVWV